MGIFNFQLAKIANARLVEGPYLFIFHDNSKIKQLLFVYTLIIIKKSYILFKIAAKSYFFRLKNGYCLKKSF